MSMSVNVFDLSSRDKPARPPRRLSNPTNSNPSPRPAPFGSVTPISEIGIKKIITQGRSDTPWSETSSSRRRKYNVLTSVSYWLTQIKLAESASKHSISLGFFKLALESGCEPINWMRDELKSYACKHDLLEELGGPMKDLSERYNILEDLQKLSISGTGLKPTEVGEQILNGDARRSSATALTGNLKSRSLNSEKFTETQADKKERAQKRSTTAKKNKALGTKPASVKDNNGKHTEKKPKNPSRMAKKGGDGKIKSSMKKTTSEEDEVDLVDPVPTDVGSHEDKENMGVIPLEESSNEEEIETN